MKQAGIACAFLLINAFANHASAEPVAQGAPSPAISVKLSPAVAARAADLGESWLLQQKDALYVDLVHDLGESRVSVSSVSLSIVDIQPLRPTPQQLGDSAQLQLASIGMPRVAVVGEIVFANGSKQPVRWAANGYEPSDCFEYIARAISDGHSLYSQAAWPPPYKARAVTGTRIPG